MLSLPNLTKKVALVFLFLISLSFRQFGEHKRKAFDCGNYKRLFLFFSFTNDAVRARLVLQLNTDLGSDLTLPKLISCLQRKQINHIYLLFSTNLFTLIAFDMQCLGQMIQSSGSELRIQGSQIMFNYELILFENMI